MGGLRRKLPITSFTMLVGVAAIIGVPLLSGWYSKDAILARVYLDALEHGSWPLAILAFGTVILTGYYMTRLWLLAFSGSPRDQHIHEHAHESPRVMLLPLVVLSVFSIGIAWGWPVWDAHASTLGHVIHLAQPVLKHVHESHDHHRTAEVIGLLCAALGVGFAIVKYRGKVQDSNSPMSQLLKQRFYFDSIYDSLVTRPTVEVSRLVGVMDKNQDESRRAATLDGAFSGIGFLVAGTGSRLSPLASGNLRGYILALGLTVTGGLAILWLIH